MKYSNQPKVSSKTVLSNFDPNVMSYSGKVTATNLPDSVTSRDSSVLTGGLGSISTNFEEFAEEVGQKLLKIQYEGQKNRLYKITILLGSYEEQVEKQWLENVRSMMSVQDPLQSILILTPGTATTADREPTASIW